MAPKMVLPRQAAATAVMRRPAAAKAVMRRPAASSMWRFDTCRVIYLSKIHKTPATFLVIRSNMPIAVMKLDVHDDVAMSFTPVERNMTRLAVMEVIVKFPRNNKAMEICTSHEIDGVVDAQLGEYSTMPADTVYSMALSQEYPVW